MKQTDSYFRFYEEIDDRLDENFNNPEYDQISVLLGKRKFDSISLKDKDFILNIASGKTPKGITYYDEDTLF